MALVRAQVELQRLSGLAEDKVINTFYFRTKLPLGPTTEELDAIDGALKKFYNGLGEVGAGAVSGFLSPVLSKGVVHLIKLYNMDQPIPRPPIRATAFALFGINGSPCPSEVALCLSYRAGLLAGVDPKRRRGRVYVGPFNVASLGSSQSSSDVLPSVTLTNFMLDAGSRLMALSSVDWVVYSPTTGQDHPILNIHVDNAFDTQRRRGGKPTSRSSANKAVT